MSEQDQITKRAVKWAVLPWCDKIEDPKVLMAAIDGLEPIKVQDAVSREAVNKLIKKNCGRYPAKSDRCGLGTSDPVGVICGLVDKLPSVLPASPDNGRVGQEPEKCYAESLRHREMFAAAYLKATDIPPEEAILVEQRTESGFEWFFKQRDEPDYEAIVKGIEEYMCKEEYRLRTEGCAMVREASRGENFLNELKAKHTPSAKKKSEGKDDKSTTD